MKYYFELRSRARKEQPIHEKHQLFMNVLSGLPAPWSSGSLQNVPVPDPKSGLSAALNLGKYMEAGIKGDVHYQYRRDFQDEPFHDDFVGIKFESKRFEFWGMAKSVFSQMIIGFDAYVAQILPDKLMDLDVYALRDMRFNARRMVHRVAPLCYFDGRLCQAAFECGPKDVMDCLRPHVEHVELLHGGVLVVTQSMDRLLPEVDAASAVLRNLLPRAK
jgi:hypothetical protein